MQRRAFTRKKHERTTPHHDLPAPVFAAVCRDQHLSGADRILDFAQAGESVAIDRSVDHPPELDVRRLPATLYRAAVFAVAREFADRLRVGHGDRRGAGVDWGVRVEPVQVHRSASHDARNSYNTNVPGDDALVAALHHHRQAALGGYIFWPLNLLRFDGLAVLHLADEGILRHDPAVAGRGRADRRVQPIQRVLADHSADCRAGSSDHGSFQFHDRLERIHRGGSSAARPGAVYLATGDQEFSSKHVDTMGALRRGVDPGEHPRGSGVHRAEPISRVGDDAGGGEGVIYIRVGYCI